MHALFEFRRWVAFVAAASVLVATAASATRFDNARCVGFPYGGAGYPHVADLDGDGLSDLLVTQQYLPDPFHAPVARLYVYRANGLWSFDPPAIYGTDLYPTYVVTGDLNHDGLPDVVVGAPGFMRVDLFRNVGAAALAFQASIPSRGHPRLLIDLDDDGNLDLISADLNGVLVVALGNGDFTFDPVSTYGMPGSITSIAAGDVSGDGRPDLVVGLGNGNAVRVMIGQPGGGLVAVSPDLQIGNPATGVALGALDGDNILDLAVGFGGVATFIGNGDGTFGSRLDYAVSFGVTDVVIGEFDGDSYSDVASMGSGEDKVTVWLGNGDGSLQGRVDYAAAGYALQAVDVNSDGRLDLVAGWQPSACALVRSQGTVTSVPGPGQTDGAVAMAPVVPNPSRDGWRAAFSLPDASTAQLTLLDLVGRRVESHALGQLPAGDHEVRFVPTRRLSPGVYWLRLTLASGQAVTRPCIVR